MAWVGRVHCGWVHAAAGDCGAESDAVQAGAALSQLESVGEGRSLRDDLDGNLNLKMRAHCNARRGDDMDPDVVGKTARDGCNMRVAAQSAGHLRETAGMTNLMLPGALNHAHDDTHLRATA